MLGAHNVRVDASQEPQRVEIRATDYVVHPGWNPELVRERHRRHPTAVGHRLHSAHLPDLLARDRLHGSAHRISARALRLGTLVRL